MLFTSVQYDNRKLHYHKRRTRQQPEEHRRRNTAGPAGSHHRPVRLGQVVAGLRHPLRRGAAPLRGKPQQLRAPVPGTHEQARVRLHQGHPARHRHRTESEQPQPALHRGHVDRNLRIPALALRPHRTDVQPRQRAGGKEALGRRHRPVHAGVSRGDALHRAHPAACAPRTHDEGAADHRP